MKELRSFLIALFGYAVCVVVSVLVSIYGWGLKPQNWWVIIGGTTLGFLFGQFIIKVSEKEDE